MILGGVLAFLRSHEPAGGDTIDHNATVPEPWEIRYAKTGEKSGEEVALVEPRPNETGRSNARRPNGRIVMGPSRANSSFSAVKDPT